MITVPQQDTNNRIIPMNGKAEHPSHNIMTPSMSPVDNQPSTAKSSLKITAGQTGLPWLSRDAENFSPTPPNDSSSHATDHNIQAVSPPPKLMARPRISSVIRFPTRKRTMQKHIYTMKDGLDPVKVLLDRLASWEVSVKYLLSMFHSIKRVESNTGKDYRKIDSKFPIPTEIKDQFKSSNGVQDAWSAFRQYTRENSLIHQDFVDFIENEIEPCLNIMLKDINSQSQSLKRNKSLRTATLWDSRKKADTIITQLNSDIYNTIRSQEKVKRPYVIPKKDPLLTKYAVIRTIRDLHKQENRLHKAFLEIQENYRQFEQSNIINVYKQLFQTFEQYRTQHRLENLDSVTRVATVFNAIENDSEWLDFVHHHDNALVKHTAVFKDEQASNYPNATHALVQPLMMGNLQRRHGKKWIRSFYILSPVGLLYRFKSEDNVLESPFAPELTMFIPQCTILINPAKNILELKGKALGVLFGSKKLFELSANDPNELERWIQVMDPIAIQQQGSVALRAMPTDQPVLDNRSAHSKVQVEDEQNQLESAKLDPIDAATNSATAGDISVTREMQPIVQGHDQQDTAERNMNELDDDDFNIQTVEYSTHAPITSETPAQNQYITHSTPQQQQQLASVSSATPSDTITSNADVTMNNNASKGNTTVPIDQYNGRPGAGPTREGSDVFWDTQ